MTPDEARARERAAREAVWATMRAYAEFGKQWANEEDAEELDAYAAAVRAATLAAVRERVEGMNTEHDTTACPMCKFGLVCNDLMHRMTFNGALREVLAALDALAGEGS